ncbi:hypothetical protein GW915_03910 [bacterium]|nr:hypothetical protein [bacterium]
MMHLRRIILSLLFGCASLSAAEYNFFFNNTEQGDNSQNTPLLNINGRTVREPTASSLKPSEEVEIKEDEVETEEKKVSSPMEMGPEFVPQSELSAAFLSSSGIKI